MSAGGGVGRGPLLSEGMLGSGVGAGSRKRSRGTSPALVVPGRLHSPLPSPVFLHRMKGKRSQETALPLTLQKVISIPRP